MSLIEMTDITKRFGATVALDDISLNFAESKIYGLLGRNGAGKSTLLNIITNRIFPDKGSVKIGGKYIVSDERSLRSVFYMTEENFYPDGCSLRALLYVSKEFYPETDIHYALCLAEKFSLNPKKKVKALSTGYLSILKAIITLSSNASILIFDEPLKGLDPNHREMLYREILANYASKEKTIIISSHLIEEISTLLEEAVIIKSGKIILQEPVETIFQKSFVVTGEKSRVREFTESLYVLSSTALGQREEALLFDDIAQDRIQVGKDHGLDISHASLQKIFIGLTNMGGSHE